MHTPPPLHNQPSPLCPPTARAHRLFSRVSGGFFNIAVSLAFLIRKRMTVKRFALYSLAQACGSFAAAALLKMATPAVRPHIITQAHTKQGHTPFPLRLPCSPPQCQQLSLPPPRGATRMWRAALAPQSSGRPPGFSVRSRNGKSSRIRCSRTGELLTACLRGVRCC